MRLDFVLCFYIFIFYFFDWIFFNLIAFQLTCAERDLAHLICLIFYFEDYYLPSDCSGVFCFFLVIGLFDCREGSLPIYLFNILCSEGFTIWLLCPWILVAPVAIEERRLLGCGVHATRREMAPSPWCAADRGAHTALPKLCSTREGSSIGGVHAGPVVSIMHGDNKSSLVLIY